MLKTWLSSVLAVGMALSLTGCGGTPSTTANDGEAASTDKKYTVNITCDASPESVTGYVVTEFQRLVQERSNGNITVNAYMNGQMGSDKEVMENVVSGQIEFAVMNSANQSTDVPAVNVFDMPAAFENTEIARAAFDDKTFRSMLEAKYEEAGIKLLMLGDQAYRETTSNKPLKTKDDFKGLNIRTMTNDVHVAFWKALGANPTPMNRSDVFLALQQGLLDAQEDPYVSSFLNNYAEVQKYNVATNHIFHNITVVVNKAFFESLPQEYQDVIHAVCSDVLVSSRAKADEVVDKSIQDMTDAGMTFMELDTDTYEWMSSVAEENIWPLIREKAGDDIVDAMLAAAEAARK